MWPKLIRQPIKSRPMRARGLKQATVARSPVLKASRPMRARGLKHIALREHIGEYEVAPHAGAWIETNSVAVAIVPPESRAPCGRVD